MKLSRINTNTGQIGFEFLILSTFLLILVAVVLGVVGYFLSSFNEANLDLEREEFAQTVQSEFQNALNSPSGFNRTFSISRDDQQRFNLTFYPGYSYFTLNDFRKYGPDSDRIYYFGVGGDFRYEENFFTQLNTSDTVNYLVVSLILENEENLVKVDLQRIQLPSASNIVSTPSMLLNFNFGFIPPTPLSFSSTPSSIEIRTNSTNDELSYSFINFDNSLIGWWRFEELDNYIIFHDNFSVWEGWNQYLNGIVEHSSERSKVGTYSLRKTNGTSGGSYSDPNGGYKLIDEEVQRDFKLEVWFYSDDPRGTLVGDRISIVDSNFQGYGIVTSPSFFGVQRVFNNSWDNAVGLTGYPWIRPENEWYRIVLESSSEDMSLRVSAYLEDGTFIGSNTTIDFDIQSFDRINVRGGHTYFVDNITLSIPKKITDESENENHGRIFGSSNLNIGKFGNALEFNGISDYLEVQNKDDFIMDESFTLSTWVKFNDNSTTLPENQFDFIVGNGGGWSEVGFMLFRCKINQLATFNHNCKDNPGLIRWEIQDSDGVIGVTDSTTQITNDMGWKHIVGVYDQSNLRMKIYIDGVLENQSTISFKTINSSNFFGFGNLSASSVLTTPLNGSIDDTLLFKRALSSQEIESLYNGSNKVNFLEVSGLDESRDYSFQAYSVNESGDVYSTEERNLQGSGFVASIEGSACFDPASVGEIGTGAPCEDMLIVNNTMLYSAGSSYEFLSGDESFELLGPDDITIYTFADDDNNIFTGQVTSLFLLFTETSFNGNINYWDTRNVTDLTGTFALNHVFNQPLNNWNVSNVISMNRTFFNSSSFNQPLNNWDVSQVELMSFMFFNSSSFNQPLNDWVTDSLRDASGIFYYASSFNQPLNSWNTSNVESSRAMFRSATSFNQSLNNLDTSNINDMTRMFRSATSFNQPLNSWNTSNVNNMSEMFMNATSFSQDISSWCVENVVVRWSFATGSGFEGNTALHPQWGDPC